VLAGKVDTTDEFALLTPIGAVKSRCIKRLEGQQSWDKDFLRNCIGFPWNPNGHREPSNPTTVKDDIPMQHPGRVKPMCLKQHILDKYGRTPGCTGCTGCGLHTEACRDRIEKQMAAAGDAVRLGGEGAEEGPAKRSRLDSAAAEASATSDAVETTGMRHESAMGSSPQRQQQHHGPQANQGHEKEACAGELATLIGAIDNLSRERPTLDLSNDNVLLSGAFPEADLRKGREMEIHSLVMFDGFDPVDRLPSSNTPVYDMVWVDERRGDAVRSRRCVHQFKREGPGPCIGSFRASAQLFEKSPTVSRDMSDTSNG